MRALATLALLSMMSLSAQADSSCLADAQKKAPAVAAALAAESLPFKGITELDGGNKPYFTIPNKAITDEARAELIAQNYLVPGDMMWPVSVFVEKEVAIENKLGNEEIHSFIGFVIIRCKSMTSSEVEKMWFQSDISGGNASSEAEDM